MADTIPVILDTDIGSDIDDAVALAYLLKQPRCELVGVTTASGAQHDRACLASAVCRAAGRDEVPIHCGPEQSLVRGVTQHGAGQATVLPRWPHRDDFPPATAIEWLRLTIRARPHEITLISIGPMTNIGLLFATDPEIPSLLKDYIAMAGRFVPGERTGPFAEWNVLCDPEAAAIAYGRAPQAMRSVGLDVTLQCQMDAEEVRTRFKASGAPMATVLDMAEQWFKYAHPRITFHDPLAAVCIFEPDICTWRRGEVRIELKSDLVPGLSWFKGAEDGRHQVASGVNVRGFFDHYFQTVVA